MMRFKVPIAEPAIGPREIEAVSSAVSSGWISGRGKYVEEFEGRFGSWIGSRNVVACSSGTAALHLALASLGVGLGSEVILPSFSMAAIPFAVSYVGADFVLVDSDMETWNLDPGDVEEKLSPRTKAVIVMHTYGHPADLGPIRKLCSDRGIALVEDAAEAHGAKYAGQKVGTLGDVGCFSFFANKIITTGEGGAVVTRNASIAETLRSLCDMAFSRDMSKKFLHERIGYNYRMTNIQAALGVAQLERADRFVETRRRNAKLYDSFLSSVDGIVTPPEARWAENVYWMYSILVTPSYPLSRDELMAELAKRGIETRPFFVPVHQQPVFRNRFEGRGFPVAESLSRTGLNLPSGNTLTPEQVEFVASTIADLGRH